MKSTIIYFTIFFTFLSCKLSNKDENIIGRDGKLYINDKTELIIRDYDKNDVLIVDGIKLKNDNKPQKAIQKFNEAEKKYGPKLSIFLNRGFCYDMLGKVEEAIKDYNKCLQIKSDYYVALQNRGLLYNEIGENGKALEDFNKAIKVNPLEPAGYLNRAYLYRSIFEIEKSCADAEKSIQLGFTEKYNSNKARDLAEEICK